MSTSLLDDAALEEIAVIMKSLTRNGPVATLAASLNHDGGTSKTEMERFKRDLMDQQRAQMTAFMEKFGEMESKIYRLQTKSEKNDSEIANLQGLLVSERESNAKMKAEINRIKGDFQMDCLIPRIAATEESINLLKADSSRETTRMDEAVKALSNISNEIKSRFNDVNESHARLSDDFQRLKESESREKMEKKICNLETESKTTHSEINTKLQSLIESERQVQVQINSLHGTIQKTLNVANLLITRTVAAEEAIKTLKEKEASKSAETCKLDEAIKVLTKEIEDRFSKMKESHEKLMDDIQRVKVAQLRFSNVEEGHERVGHKLLNIKTAMEQLEKRMQSAETPVRVTETDHSLSKVPDEIKQLNLPMLVLPQHIKLEVPLTLANQVDACDQDIPLITIDDEEKEDEPPQVQKELDLHSPRFGGRKLR